MHEAFGGSESTAAAAADATADALVALAVAVVPTHIDVESVGDDSEDEGSSGAGAGRSDDEDAGEDDDEITSGAAGNGAAGAGKSKPRRARDCAVIRARDLSTTPDSGIHIRAGDVLHPEYELVNQTQFAPKNFAWRGWARRPRNGHKMGTTLVGPWRQKIVELFKNEGRNKLSPAGVLQTLKELPGSEYRLDMCTENDVRKELTRLLAYRTRQQKAGKECNYEKFVDDSKDPVSSVHSAFVDRCFDRVGERMSKGMFKYLLNAGRIANATRMPTPR
jgi:hypothetical protein